MLLRFMIAIALTATASSAKPIMVSFGTNGGPIVPPTPSTTTLNPLAPKTPAPVFEEVDDVPPKEYRPPTPNQYRNLITSYKPKTDLQLGTPLDIKYQDLNTVGQLEVQQQKAEIARQEGLSYSGAQVFAVQEYEFANARDRQQGLQPLKRLSNAQQFVQQYVPKHQRQIPTNRNESNNQKQHLDQTGTDQQSQPQTINQYVLGPIANDNRNAGNFEFNDHNEYVPAIGIAYSSGLRYYVPQFYYFDSRHQQELHAHHHQHPHQPEVRENAIYEQ